MTYDDEFDAIIEDIISDHIEYNEDVDDLLHRKLDEYIACNHYRKNN